MGSVGCVVGCVLVWVFSVHTPLPVASYPPLLVYFCLPPPAKPEGGGHYGRGIMEETGQGSLWLCNRHQVAISCSQLLGGVRTSAWLQKQRVSYRGCIHATRQREQVSLSRLEHRCHENADRRERFQPAVQWNKYVSHPLNRDTKSQNSIRGGDSPKERGMQRTPASAGKPMLV